MTLNTPKKIATGTPFEFGEHRFRFGEEIVELADSTSLLNNFGALHRKIREDGSWLGNFYNKGVSYRPIVELRREWELD